MTFVNFFNQLLGILTIFSQIASALLVVFLVTKKPAWVRFFGQHALLGVFLVALGATIGSLIYSDILNYAACKLCWFQRIVMYPQVLLLGMALYKKDTKIVDYSLALAVLGVLLAGYHYLLQLGLAPSIPCSAVESSVSCSKIFLLQYGYITIPMMALSTFGLMTLLLLAYKKTAIHS